MSQRDSAWMFQTKLDTTYPHIKKRHQGKKSAITKYYKQIQRNCFCDKICSNEIFNLIFLNSDHENAAE